MIKRIENRFFWGSIMVISLVLLVMLLGVNIMTRQSNIQKVDQILNNMSAKGIDPLFETDIVEELFSDNLKRKDGGHGSGTSQAKRPGDTNESNDLYMDRIPYTRDDNRTFEILMDHDQALLATTSIIKNIADNDEAYDLAIEAYALQKEKGFVDDYRFARVDFENFSRFIFMDYSVEKDLENDFLFISILFYFMTVGLFAFIVRLALAPVMKPAKQAYVKQKQFITDASHELKTPLTIISTNMQLAEMDHGETDWVKSINFQTKRMEKLCNDLVSLSRLDEKTLDQPYISFNLSDLVNEAVIGFEPAFMNQGKSFEAHIEDGIGFKGDFDKIENVISVLLHNALKYSKANGYVSINLEKKKKGIELSIENSTDTIEKGNQNILFERFYRNDKSRNSKKGGFGLGLAIAKSVVEDHNGKIHAHSKDGKSLTVIVTL